MNEMSIWPTVVMALGTMFLICVFLSCLVWEIVAKEQEEETKKSASVRSGKEKK